MTDSSEITNEITIKNRIHTLIPSCYMLTSALFYSLQYLDVKILSKNHGIWTITFFRGLVGILLCEIAIVYNKVRPFYGNEIFKLIVRGILGSLALASSFFAIKNLDISLAIIIMATSSLWTGLFSLYKYPGSWNIYNTIGALLCLLGLSFSTIYAYNNKNNNFWYGILTALGSAILVALINVTISDIKNENTYVIILYSMVFCLIISSIGMIFEILSQGLDVSFNLIELCLAGLASFLAQFCKTRSLQLTTNIGVIVLRYFDIVFTLIFDILILHTKIVKPDIICIILILVGCIINYFGKS